MESDTWDDDAEPSVTAPKVPVLPKNKWADEDVEEDVMDSWDQEPEEDEGEPATSPAPPTKKNLKKLGEKFEEKEKRRKEQKIKETEEKKELTPEELLAEKRKRQQLQEESDLKLAKEVFGVIGSNGLESKEDYDKLKDEVLKLISDSTKNNNFATFTEELVQSLCVHLNSTDIKKIHTWLGNLHIEKSKIEKGDKGKKSKGKGKAKLKMEGDNDYSEYTPYADDFDDFI